ncbi:MAG: cutinase family protein [Candidatus Saccharibacteria bacterium]|nr:cutinase family protein [Candidatus Saccharibacteria bacterium]
MPVSAVSSSGNCPDLEVIFIRGSGEEQDAGGNYKEFKIAMQNKMKKKAALVSYAIHDLKYRAVGIDLEVATGAVLSGANAYELADSVQDGISKLKADIAKTSARCSETKFAIVGYSQGAMIASKILPALDVSKMIYVATVGDPELILPEGKNGMACIGAQLSDYRVNVPDCRVYKGILVDDEDLVRGYRPDNWIGKLGTWCNNYDFMCGSSFNWVNLIGGHIGYVEQGRYEEVADKIAHLSAEKIPKTESTFTPPGASDNDNISSGYDQELGVTTVYDVPVDERNHPSARAKIDEIFERQLPVEIVILNSCVRATSTDAADIAEGAGVMLVSYYYSNISMCTVTPDKRPLSRSLDEAVIHMLNDFKNHLDANVRVRVYLANNEIDTGGILNSNNETALQKLVAKYVMKTTVETTKTSRASVMLASTGSFRILNKRATNNIETGKDTVELSLVLPVNATGVLVTLNNGFLGIVDRNTLSQNNMKLTIKDLNPYVENKITVQVIDGEGRLGESLEYEREAINKPFILAPNTGIRIY